MVLDAILRTRVVEGMAWDSRIIESCTDSRWSHAEALQGEMTFGAQLKGGVKWRRLDDPCYRNVQRIAEIDIACTKEQEQRVWQFWLAQDGKPYDWRAIISFVPIFRRIVNDRNWRDEDAWFCDELLIAGLLLEDLIYVPEDLQIVSFSPRDYWLMIRQYPNVTTRILA